MIEKDGLPPRGVHIEDGIWTYLYFMCMSACLHVYMCVTCVPGAHKGQKRDLDPLELTLHIVISCHVGFGSLQEQQVFLLLNHLCHHPEIFVGLFVLFFLFFPIHPQAVGPYLNLPNDTALV